MKDKVSANQPGKAQRDAVVSGMHETERERERELIPAN